MLASFPQAPRGVPAVRRPSVTVVVPTFREAENLPQLLDRLGAVRKSQGLALDVVVVDDNSQDGSEELVKARPETWIQIVVRKQDRGLSTAVLEGLRRAHGDVIVCMDADLSHPPAAIPAMLDKLEDGADFVVGSRYVDGGSTSDDWGFFRWLNSRVATLLARPLTAVRDPMAGFFALRRSTFESGRDFSPIGYKIGLELMVRCGCERVVEVPIHFEDRQLGQSKLTLTQQLLYLQHLRRLYIHKYGAWSQLLQFLVVGALGTVVNLVALTLLLKAGLATTVAVGAAITIAMCCNFVLNRRFSFSHARTQAWPRQFGAFAAASSVGVLINYGVTIAILSRVPGTPAQAAALAGIAVGTFSNFLASRYLVFRSSHVRAGARH